MKTSCTISFGQNGFDIRDDAVITLLNGGLQPFGDLNALTSDSVPSVPYATFESNFWLLDGNYKIAPSSNAKGGWVSTAQSAGTGDFTFSVPEPELQIDFDVVHSTDGLYLTFSPLTGDYGDRIMVTFLDGSLALIRQDVYTPTGTTFFTNQPVMNFKRIHLEIHSTNRASRYARLSRIDFDEITRFTGEQVKSATIVEHINPLSIELPINTIDFSLFSDDGNFSIVEPTGVYATLQYKEPLDVHADLGGEIIYMGRFYLDEWESVSENLAEFKASDAIGILNEMDFLGTISMPDGLEDAEDIILDIFDDTNISYILDASFNNVTLRGWLSVSTKREALQQMCLTLGAIATCVRSRVVNIVPMELVKNLTSYDHTLTNTQKSLGSLLSLKTLVTGVELDSHNYTSNDDEGGYEQVFSGTLTAGVHRIYFSTAPVWGNFSVNGVSNQFVVNKRSTYVELNIPSTQSVTILATRMIGTQKKYSFYNNVLPADAKSNIIRILDLTALANGYDVDPQNVTQRIYDYYQQRYSQKTKLFGSIIAPNDSALIDVQNGKQLKGIVERMETDLTGGFISDVEIVGVLT